MGEGVERGAIDLAALLTREHEEIDEGIERYLASVRAMAPDVAPLQDAMVALRRHIYLEETFVFPGLASGPLGIPIQVMMREHGAIWRSMDVLAERLAAHASPDSLTDDCRELLSLLESHNAKEEPVIYPRAEPALDGATLAELGEFVAAGRMPEGWVCRTAVL